MATIGYDEAEALGRTAAHMGITQTQLAAILNALRFARRDANAAAAQVAETARRQRLIWIARRHRQGGGGV